MINEELLHEKKIELHHQTFDEIMGNPPARIVTIGSGIILILIVGLFIGSMFFSYSTVDTERALIQGKMPLTALILPESGEMVEILSLSDKMVYPGDTIALLKTKTKEMIPVMASDEGILELNPLAQAGQGMQQNDTVALIWDKEPSPSICIINLSPERIKQIHIGNKIRLHFDKYPSEQFGTVNTYVQSVNTFNAEEKFRIITGLPDSLVTSGQFAFTARGKLYASAEIITDEQTLFNRLLNPFRGLLKKE